MHFNKNSGDSVGTRSARSKNSAGGLLRRLIADLWVRDDNGDLDRVGTADVWRLNGFCGS